ncbi:uncharacterized protein CANTADRAFT_7232 [Suhomyces tanzawaensis NRRL Y-17324]|uniref:Nucleoside transporter n=1 Tax=Suhomyces tanzawaensis NRRL Y-17324 TaxID=984487 RepID=A0A1E4SDY9_9ASCO|nr:uncharacterized protein CANTADRAFT_7232 [Suhomyces tanzawaensis NRRL Y-17324]ODV77734.1 hypothetical protein CANTADRAFT_7232 [Suhomyces tanzawaensis NRRL Y-17324]
MREEYDPIVLKTGSVRLSQLKYFTFSLVGIALLWPFNCFLSASAYYGERFAHSPSLVKVYSSTMMSVSTVSSTLYNYYLSQAQAGVNYQHRLNLGLGITIVVFVIMAISCISDWFIRMPDVLFFGILMVLVFLSALATCLAQNGTMAIVNVLGSIYANAVMVGQAVAGVLPSLALIILILIVGEGPKSITELADYVEKDLGVFVYYITASVIAVGSIASIYWVNSYGLNGYQLVNENEDHDFDTGISGPEEPEGVTKKHVPFATLWSKLKLIVLTIFLTFSITLIFPVFASKVESTHESKNRFLQKNIYIPFIYLIWNLGDLLGRVLCGYPRLRMLIKNPRTLLTYSIGRLVFIPLFLTCNIHPGVSKPVINSDLWYILLQLLFGISNGQLCTSCFMIVGDYCEEDEKEAAGGFTTVFLSVGLAVGSLLSYFLVMYID